ncbi:TPA: hypothetical protein ACWX1I_003726 [Elizabethkingia anophelis]
MKKRLFCSVLWGIVALSTLSSCRTEDNITQQKEEKDMRFAVFVPQSEKTINYANGFAYLMQRYDNLHKTNLSGVVNNNPVIGNFNASTDKSASIAQPLGSYIEFRIHSQTIIEKNGDKWVVFPRVEGEKVIGLLLAILSNKETNVSFKTIDSQTQWYSDNIGKFQDAFTNYRKRSKFLNLSASINPIADGAGCKNENGEYVDCSVPEVIITVPKDPGAPQPIVAVISTGVDAGSCSDFQNCYAGGGGGDPSPPVDDPCSKMKSKIATENGRKIIKDLEAKMKVPENPEYAYRQDKNGDTKMYQGEQDNVIIPIDNNMEGVYHDHQDGGVPMLSVKDIRMMLIAARMQSDENIGNAFVGMISKSGNYFVSFTGSKADIPVITDGPMIDELRKAYDKMHFGMLTKLPVGVKELSSTQLEQLFFKTIENMGLTGKVSLIKEKDGSTTEIKQDANGIPRASDPC